MAFLNCYLTCYTSLFAEARVQNRIVGGRTIHEKEKLPFLAAFTFNKVKEKAKKRPKLTCSASLIATKWVISAAHCLGKKKDISEQLCPEASTIF